jgi:hypothetical protein
MGDPQADGFNVQILVFPPFQLFPCAFNLNPCHPCSSVAPLKKGSRESKKFNIIGATHKPRI